MSFNDLKNKHGTRVIQAVALYPNACKYSVDETINKGLCTADAAVSENYTGLFLINETSGSDVLFFRSANPYLETSSGEVIKVTIDNANRVYILSRAEFGTTASAIQDNEQLRIMHGGEADSSCRGYPQRPGGKGCSNSDSFDRNVAREILITDTQLVAGEIYFNGLNSISHSPTLLKPGEEMAKNSSVNVSIQDNEDGDQYTVPYPKLRTDRSTLLRKLHARTGGFLVNRKMVVYSGFTVGNRFERENCISREYIIDDFSISKDDSVSIKGIDPLILSEEVKAKTHDTSSGLLLSAIDETTTEITLKNFLPGEYGTAGESGTVLIDSELIDYTVSGSGVLTVVNRGVAGSEQKDHSVNASVQKCLTFNGFNPVDEIINMLKNRTFIESRFFGDYSEAAAKVVNNLGKVYITKPIAVKDFVNDIIKTWSENNIALYFDELGKKVRIKAAGDFEQQPITLTDIDFKIDSVDINTDYSSQITRASIGFAPFDASKSTNDENSSIIYQSINLGLELKGTLEPNEAKTFYSQYLTDSDVDVSIAVGGIGRKVGVNNRPPQQFSFTVDYEKYGEISGGLIEEGEIINVTTELSIDDDGQPKSENLQILSIKDDMKNKQVTITAGLYQDIVTEADFDFIIDEDKENYDLSSEFKPAEPGKYTVFIASNVTIGATSRFVKAFTTGAQNNGVTFKIAIRGSILGAGGDGANGRDAVAPVPQENPGRVYLDGLVGTNGGDAIELTVDCELDVSQGVIYSGGAGAPSTYSLADSSVQPYLTFGGNGGSGGQGYIGGAGGVKGTASIDGALTDYGQAGQSGTRVKAGVTGAISAGAWGQDSGFNNSSGPKSSAGYAIKSNGNSVILIGDNDATIRGKRDF